MRAFNLLVRTQMKKKEQIRRSTYFVQIANVRGPWGLREGGGCRGE